MQHAQAQCLHQHTHAHAQPSYIALLGVSSITVDLASKQNAWLAEAAVYAFATTFKDAPTSLWKFAIIDDPFM